MRVLAGQLLDLVLDGGHPGHAAEDRKQRELAETRNVAENAAYQAEKQVAELGAQLSGDDKQEIEKAIAEVKAVLDSSDVNEIKAKTEAMQAAFHKVSEQIYQQAAAQQAASGDGAGGAEPSGNGAGAEEEVVDAEVVDDERS